MSRFRGSEVEVFAFPSQSWDNCSTARPNALAAMASRSFHALFLRARDHFAGSSHWAYFTVLVLALVHVLAITPFIAGSRLESETNLQKTRLTAVESSLGELRGALEAVRQETSTIVAPALERLIEDLEGDLARLDASRRQIAAVAAAAAEDAAGEGSEADGTPALPPQEPVSTVQPLMLNDPDRIADLRDARTPDQLLAALAPLVEELITRPRFFDLERGWKDDALPRLEARLDTAASALPRLRSRFPEARSQWQTLAGSLSALSHAARELRFEPPARPYWWVRASSDEIEIGLTAAVADEIRHPHPLAELEAAADRSVESYSEIVGKVARAKRQLGEPDAGTLPWLDLTAVAMFPLLLGLALGGVLIWRSQRLRELGLAIRLAIDHGAPAALKRWFWSQAQWSTAAGTSAANAWRACVAQTLLAYFLAMSWIALAAVQLRQIDNASHRLLMIYTVAGASAVLLGVINRLFVARRAIMALDHDDAGTLADGTLADGTLADGTLADGTLADGTLADGTLADGTLADGTVADVIGAGRVGDRHVSHPPGQDRPENIDTADRAPEPDDELLGIRPLKR